MVRPNAASSFAVSSPQQAHRRLVLQAEVEATLQRILAHKVSTQCTPCGSCAAHAQTLAEMPA